METRLGIFHSVADAEQVIAELVSRDIPRDSLILLSTLSPQRSGAGSFATAEEPKVSQSATAASGRAATERELDKVAQPAKAAGSAGKNSGEAIGATVGATAGFTAGATVASLMVPGLGLIFAIGLGAAALLGVGGAAAGAGVGNTLEKNVDMGFPPEEVDFYRQLLRQGKSLVIAKVRSGADTTTVQEAFRQRGSEDVDAARERLGKAA